MSISITFLSNYLGEHDFRPSVELTRGQTEETKDLHLPWKGGKLPWKGLTCLSVISYVLKFCYDPSMELIRDQTEEINPNLPCKGLSCSSCVSYIIKLCTDPDQDDVIHTIIRLNDLAGEYESISEEQQTSDTTPTKLKMERQFSETFVNCFMPKVCEFFTFPKRNEHIVDFVNFLLQVLNSELNSIGHEEHVPVQKGLMSLQNELTFLLAVLGDAPFQLTELQGVKNLLTEFGEVAKEAGSFIYTSIFSTCPTNGNRFLSNIGALTEMVDFLKEKIKEHCIKFSELPLSNPRNTSAADSLFIINSVLVDLESVSRYHDELTDIMKNELRTLHGDLISARSFLKDINAQLQPDIDIKELKGCTLQIRDIAYEAEYLISSFLVDNIPTWYLATRIPNVLLRLKLIRRRFEEVTTSYGIQDFRLEEQEPAPLEAVEPSPVTANDHNLVGFEDEMLGILDDLTGGSEDLQTISIYGMPGLGKTTLAKKVYNHRLITDHFDECVWCVVSQTYEKRKALFEILMCLRSMQKKRKLLNMGDEMLLLEIYKTLKGRRYLIVLDDVWDSDVWGDFRRYFPNDRNGSRVLFTSRIQDTAPINSIVHTLPLLSNDQCWKLLEKKVFCDETCPLQLQNSGRQIAAKCNGLPLAVIIIAGALANIAKEKTAWQKIEQNIDTYTSDCMKILELSYNHLPDHLKLCFLYLGIFPEDAEIPVRRLIQLWIVEGFIPKDEHKSQEQVAEDYLMDLIDRSLIRVARTRSTGGVKACNVHDLLREMCLQRAKEENFLDLIKDDNCTTSRRYHQRLCIASTAPPHLRPFSIHCRSFFGHISDPSSCFPQMKHLRVMELLMREGMTQTYIFQRMDLLVCLRYLVINHIIPESILHSLVNLEVLRVHNTLGRVDVSNIIRKLFKLRRLHVKQEAIFTGDCHGYQHNSLQSISTISMKHSADYENLRSLPHLRKLKCVCLPLLPDFHFLMELESLKIVVGHFSDTVPRNNTSINFPPSIRKLSLAGTGLPWERMTILGRLPELQALKLHWDAFEGEEWETSDDEFQKLRFLELGTLKLAQWISSSEHFPRLHHLVLVSCNRLESVPTALGNSPSLQMIEVHECTYGASISAVQVEQEQRDNGNEELKVIISNRRWSKEQLLFEYNEIEQEQFSAKEEAPLHRLGSSNPTVHFRVGCDYCGIDSIIGDRYKCKDCVEESGYDLCADCFSSSNRSEFPGRFSQEHTSEHKFERVTSSLYQE